MSRAWVKCGHCHQTVWFRLDEKVLEKAAKESTLFTPFLLSGSTTSLQASPG